VEKFAIAFRRHNCHGFLQLLMLKASRTRTEHLVHLNLQTLDRKLPHQHNMDYIMYSSKDTSMNQLMTASKKKTVPNTKRKYRASTSFKGKLI